MTTTKEQLPLQTVTMAIFSIVRTRKKKNIAVKKKSSSKGDDSNKEDDSNEENDDRDQQASEDREDYDPRQTLKHEAKLQLLQQF